MAQFDLHRLTADSVTFRHWDSERGRQALVEVTVSQWESWDRPVSLVVTASPAPRIAPDPSPAPAVGGRVRVLAKAGAPIAAAIDVELAGEPHEADR